MPLLSLIVILIIQPTNKSDIKNGQATFKKIIM